MRFVETGIGPDGRSAVISDEVLDSGEDDSRYVVARKGAGRTANLWATQEAPPTVHRPTDVSPHDLACPPGGTIWKLWEAPAGVVADMHRTNTLDYDVIAAGSATLMRQSGEIELHRGDAVVIPDILHGWKSGPHSA
jgi:hypothetical protein